MPSILPILCYADMMEAPFSLESQQIFTYDDMAGNACPFLSLTWKSRCAIPGAPGIRQRPGEPGAEPGILLYAILPSTRESSSTFYSNYKDYYYLPLEDTAIHKSVGEYVDRDARTKPRPGPATQKSKGSSSPSSGSLWSPALMQEYKASLTYAEYEPEMLTPDGMADAYARQILSYVSQAKEL